MIDYFSSSTRIGIAKLLISRGYTVTQRTHLQTQPGGYIEILRGI